MKTFVHRFSLNEVGERVNVVHEISPLMHEILLSNILNYHNIFHIEVEHISGS